MLSFNVILCFISLLILFMAGISNRKELAIYALAIVALLFTIATMIDVGTEAASTKNLVTCGEGSISRE